MILAVHVRDKALHKDIVGYEERTDSRLLYSSSGRRAEYKTMAFLNSWRIDLSGVSRARHRVRSPRLTVGKDTVVEDFLAHSVGCERIGRHGEHRCGPGLGNQNTRMAFTDVQSPRQAPAVHGDEVREGDLQKCRGLRSQLSKASGVVGSARAD